MVYQDYNVTDIAIAGLHGLKMGERTLTVRRAEVCARARGEGGGCCTGCVVFKVSLRISRKMKHVLMTSSIY